MTFPLRGMMTIYESATNLNHITLSFIVILFAQLSPCPKSTAHPQALPNKINCLSGVAPIVSREFTRQTLSALINLASLAEISFEQHMVPSARMFPQITALSFTATDESTLKKTFSA